jgi:predicted branched-subunit amino acid permease
VLVGTALFVAMLVPRLVSLPSWVAALVAAVAALAVTQVAPHLAILAGAAAGMVAAVAVSSRRESS